MNLVELIEKEGIKTDVAKFKVGDTVRVHFKIVEGSKERIQVFEGLVIARKNGSIRETFTVRKISFGVGVERTFPVHSPRIDKIEVVREGAVRRAKLYYIRDLTGKAATKVKEKRRITDDASKKVVRTEKEKLETLKSNKAKATAKKEGNAKAEKANVKGKRNITPARAAKKAAKAEAKAEAKVAEQAEGVTTPEAQATEAKE